MVLGFRSVCSTLGTEDGDRTSPHPTSGPSSPVLTQIAPQAAEGTQGDGPSHTSRARSVHSFLGGRGGGTSLWLLSEPIRAALQLSRKRVSSREGSLEPEAERQGQHRAQQARNTCKLATDLERKKIPEQRQSLNLFPVQPLDPLTTHLLPSCPKELPYHYKYLSAPKLPLGF